MGRLLLMGAKRLVGGAICVVGALSKESLLASGC